MPVMRCRCLQRYDYTMLTQLEIRSSLVSSRWGVTRLSHSGVNGEVVVMEIGLDTTQQLHNGVRYYPRQNGLSLPSLWYCSHVHWYVCTINSEKTTDYTSAVIGVNRSRSRSRSHGHLSAKTDVHMHSRASNRPVVIF